MGDFLENSIFLIFWAKIDQISTKKRDFWKSKTRILPKITFFHQIFSRNDFLRPNNTTTKPYETHLLPETSILPKFHFEMLCTNFTPQGAVCPPPPQVFILHLLTTSFNLATSATLILPRIINLFEAAPPASLPIKRKSVWIVSTTLSLSILTVS